MSTKILFAYESNMNTNWLRSRVSSVQSLERARLLNKRMVCNKKGKDNSGKANLIESSGNVVWGVLYEITVGDLNKLDRVEKSYQRTKLQALTDQGKSITAEVYISTRITSDPTPYD